MSESRNARNMFNKKELMLKSKRITSKKSNQKRLPKTDMVMSKIRKPSMVIFLTLNKPVP